MAKSVINFDIVNCVLLVVILIIVIICCMKKENYKNSSNPPPTVSAPNCKSSNPCSHLRGKDGHRQCSLNKWKECAAINGSNFCKARQIQAENSTEPMKVCDTNERGWKWYDPRLGPVVPQVNYGVPQVTYGGPQVAYGVP